VRNGLTILFLLAILAGCSTNNSITESEAITQALKSHPDFPKISGETKIIEVPTGGKHGSIASAYLTTKAEKVDKKTYHITFTKDWNLKINGKDILRYWKYRVTPNGYKLIESQGNDRVLQTIK
jgi:hypothetical protein